MSGRKVAVLFIDILGGGAADLAASAAPLVERGGGEILRRGDDGLMASFATAAEALAVSDALTHDLPAGPARMRIGLHFGPAEMDAESLAGEAVTVAARLAGQAGCGQVLLTGETARLLPPDQRSRLRYHDDLTLRGGESFTLLEVVAPEDDDATLMTGRRRPAPVAGAVLGLAYGGELVRVAGAAPLVIGRDGGCGLVVDNAHASRRHATISRDGAGWVIEDHSTNGTWLVDQTGRPYRLSQARATLTGSGRISLGRHPDQAGAAVLLYQLAGE